MTTKMTAASFAVRVLPMGHNALRQHTAYNICYLQCKLEQVDYSLVLSSYTVEITVRFMHRTFFFRSKGIKEMTKYILIFMTEYGPGM